MQFEETFYPRLVAILLCRRSVQRRGQLWLAGCLLFLSSVTFAQQIVDNQCTGVGIYSGNLKVVTMVGCAPHKVVVSNTQIGSVKSRYIYDYKGGAPEPYKPVADSVFTYTKPGLYYLMQISESAQGLHQRACAIVTVQDPAPPDFRLLPCSNGSVTLTITTNANNRYDEYAIEWGDGNVSIINKFTTRINHQYTDKSPKQISVQGIYTISKCGGRASRMVSFETTATAATLTKLEILDSVTGELTVNNPNMLELELYRQEGTGTFQTTGKIIRTADEKTKVAIDTNKIFCYKLKPLDSCVASLESNVLCVTFLKVTPDIEHNTVSIIPYRYPSEITKMTVTRNDAPWWSPGFTDLFRIDNQAECGKPSCYRLQLETQKGTVLSNKVCADPPPALCIALSNVYAPDVFTPNGDGVNDFFEVKGEVGIEIQVLVYDRWGTVIFRNSVNVRHWNGIINGQPAPAGPYFYRINFVDKIGRSFVKRGTVSLLR